MVWTGSESYWLTAGYAYRRKSYNSEFEISRSVHDEGERLKRFSLLRWEMPRPEQRFLRSFGLCARKSATFCYDSSVKGQSSNIEASGLVLEFPLLAP